VVVMMMIKHLVDVVLFLREKQGEKKMKKKEIFWWDFF